MLAIDQSTILRWSRGFNISSTEDISHELQLMRLEIDAGTYQPNFDVDSPCNLGLIYYEVRKRLGESQLSWQGLADEDECNAFSQAIIDAAANNDLEQKDLPKALDDFLADLSLLRAIDNKTICEVFSVGSARRAREIRSEDLIGNLVRRAAKQQGLDELSLQKLAEEVMATGKAKSCRRYSDELKIQVVSEITQNHLSVAEAAARTGVNKDTIYTWLKTYS